jgi:hypothetical protein
MNDLQLRTLAELRDFLNGSSVLHFSLKKSEMYGFISRTVHRFNYNTLTRKDKSTVLRFIEKVTSYSKPQVNRLVLRGCKPRKLVRKHRTTNPGFKTHYTGADALLLAQTDDDHDTLSGCATKQLMYRAYNKFHETKYIRLANISTSHIYNLRKGTIYQHKRRVFTATRNTAVSIGIRKAPNPDNQPGFLRVDSVHQGDQDGEKGVYHINAVDIVTQYECVVTCQRIRGHFMLESVKQLLDSFPFVILGFHSDNGSEYINIQIAHLLEELLNLKQTKSRSRHSNDNAQAESKNGSIIRKNLGRSHIPQRFADIVNAYCRTYLNPYINYHRPCFYAEIKTDKKGKEVKTYPYKLMMTPYEKLKSLDDAEQYLKEGITFEMLDAESMILTDNESAKRMHQARTELFRKIHES